MRSNERVSTMSQEFDGKTFYKGRMMFAPIWIAEPDDACYIRARWGFVGEILLDIVQGLVLLNANSQGFPVVITDKDWIES
jgi:hypothetical protein